MTSSPVDPLESALLSGAVRALRRRASSIRARASVGISFAVLDNRPPVRIVTSESATALRIAKSFDAIADAIEAEAP